MTDFKVLIDEQITDDIFDKIIELDSKFYKDDYLWNAIYQRQIYLKNKKSIIALLKEDKLVGYINYLNIKKEKYDNIKHLDDIVDEYEIDDIEEFKYNKDNYVTINSIVIDLEFQNGDAVKIITNEFKKEMQNLNKNGYFIKGISSTAVSADGRKFLTNLTFKEYKKLTNNNTLFLLEDNSLEEYLN